MFQDINKLRVHYIKKRYKTLGKLPRKLKKQKLKELKDKLYGELYQQKQYILTGIDPFDCIIIDKRFYPTRKELKELYKLT